VRETAEDLAELQRILDESHTSAGPHLRGIFSDTQRMTAQELVDTLDGVFEMHLAAVTASGAPLVAPVDGLLFHGKVWFGLPPASVRARLLRRDPRVSASYVAGSFGLIVHGTACPLEPGSSLAQEFDELVVEAYSRLYGPGWIEWRERQQQEQDPSAAFGGWIEPRRMFAKR
jgi:hypothetical protein